MVGQNQDGDSINTALHRRRSQNSIAESQNSETEIFNKETKATSSAATEASKSYWSRLRSLLPKRSTTIFSENPVSAPISTNASTSRFGGIASSFFGSRKSHYAITPALDDNPPSTANPKAPEQLTSASSGNGVGGGSNGESSLSLTSIGEASKKSETTPIKGGATTPSTPSTLEIRQKLGARRIVNRGTLKLFVPRDNSRSLQSKDFDSDGEFDLNGEVPVRVANGSSRSSSNDGDDNDFGISTPLVEKKEVAPSAHVTPERKKVEGDTYFGSPLEDGSKARSSFFESDSDDDLSELNHLTLNYDSSSDINGRFNNSNRIKTKEISKASLDKKIFELVSETAGVIRGSSPLVKENFSAREVAIRKSDGHLKDSAYLDYGAKSVLRKAKIAREIGEEKEQKKTDYINNINNKVITDQFGRRTNTLFTDTDFSKTFGVTFVKCFFDEGCILPTDPSSIDPKYFSGCKFGEELFEGGKNAEFFKRLEGCMTQNTDGSYSTQPYRNPSSIFKPKDSFQLIGESKVIDGGRGGGRSRGRSSVGLSGDE